MTSTAIERTTFGAGTALLLLLLLCFLPFLFFFFSFFLSLQMFIFVYRCCKLRFIQRSRVSNFLAKNFCGLRTFFSIILGSLISCAEISKVNRDDFMRTFSFNSVCAAFFLDLRRVARLALALFYEYCTEQRVFLVSFCFSFGRMYMLPSFLYQLYFCIEKAVIVLLVVETKVRRRGETHFYRRDIFENKEDIEEKKSYIKIVERGDVHTYFSMPRAQVCKNAVLCRGKSDYRGIVEPPLEALRRKKTLQLANLFERYKIMNYHYTLLKNCYKQRAFLEID